jgi:glycosyltransferase involved in cell wall biosynthesis
MNNRQKPAWYIFAYWHDRRFKKQQGGLIRIFELADSLVESGVKVILFLPKLGMPKNQTKAYVVEIPVIDLPLVRPLSFQIFLLIHLLSKLPNRDSLFYIRQMYSFVPMLIAKFLRIRIMFEMPNDPYKQYPKMTAIKRMCAKKLDKYSMLLADGVIALSLCSARRLSLIGRVNRSKIAICPSGTNTEAFKPKAKRECCAALNLNKSYTYVGFVGTFLEHQGIDVLIDAACLVLKEKPSTKFLLVGDGPMRGTWEKRVLDLGISESFIFSGHVKYKVVPEFIGVMDVCVAPVRENSNQASPVKIFDYMACGRPVIASDIEMIREIDVKSGCVLHFEPDSAEGLASKIMSLLKSPERRRKMGEEARKVAVGEYDRKMIFRRLAATTVR